jgi:hypothetical protein
LLSVTLLKPLTHLVLFEQRRAVDLKEEKGSGGSGRKGGGIKRSGWWGDRGVEVE